MLKFDVNYVVFLSVVFYFEFWCAECLREACASVFVVDVFRRGVMCVI